MSVLQTTSSVITAFGAIATAVLVYIAVQDMRLDHERSRRENAVNLIKEANNSIKPNHLPCLDFVAALPKNAAEELFSKRDGPLQLPADQGVQKHLKLCLPREFYSAEQDLLSNKLSYNSKSYISSEVTSLLNTLEHLCSAYRYSIASTQIIHEQFAALLYSDELSAVASHLKATRFNKSLPSLFYVVDNKQTLAPNPTASKLGAFPSFFDAQ